MQTEVLNDIRELISGKRVKGRENPKEEPTEGFVDPSVERYLAAKAARPRKSRSPPMPQEDRPEVDEPPENTNVGQSTSEVDG